ncbi:MAG: hypothetical protein R2780_13895 [Crocinitomicaceae bacterium]
MRTLLIALILFISINGMAQNSLMTTALEGNWMGIDMYQDEDTYDGKNYFLPNKEFMVIEKERIKIYFYPFSKSDEFDVKIENGTIKYKMGRKHLETDFSFTSSTADTLIFTMHFINKTFVKMYHRITSLNDRKEIDHAVINELDKYGFNPSALTHLFELDTFHHELYKGFYHLDSLGFTPFKHLQFKSDLEMVIDKDQSVSIERGYKTIKYTYQGKQEEFRISHSEGTQSLTIVPVSMCGCDSLHIPYLTVNWADRIRKDMKENSYKYKETQKR